MRRTIPILLLAVCSISLAVLAWRQHAELEAAAPVLHKAALLAGENDSLRAALAEEKRVAEHALDFQRRVEIKKRVVEIRRLHFREPVVYETLQRANIRQVLDRKLSEQYSVQDMRDMATGYGALGLLPPGFPLRDTFISLLGEQLAAFYDQHAHKLFMFDDATLDNAQNRVILAHELTHALQDQNYNLLHYALEAKHDDDAALAASSLVEGDATAVMSQFMATDASWHTLADTVTLSMTQSMKAIRSAPPYMRECLVFPYLQGQRFCAEVGGATGEGGLARVYAQPPTSTAQILHPELYYGTQREEPVPVSFPTTTLRGEQPLADNVAGEFGCRILFEQGLDAGAADAAAAGWRGDRYLVYSNGDDLIWKTVWRTPEAAQAAAAAYTASCQHRFGGQAAHERRGDVEITHWPDQHVLEAIPSGPGGMTFIVTLGRERADFIARSLGK